MATTKSNFLDKVLGRIDRLDAGGLQTVLQRLARERRLLETVFNIIEDGVLVVDLEGRILYFNQAVTRLLGLVPENAEGEAVTRYLPDLDWERLSALHQNGDRQMVRHEFEAFYPRHCFLRLYAAPLDIEADNRDALALIIHDDTEARQRTFEAVESEKIQALTLLSASVAHEIGNPLNALHIHLQLMERELKKWRAWRKGRPPTPRRLRRPRDPLEDSGEVEEMIAKLERYHGVAKGEISRLDYIVTQFLQAIRPSQPQLKSGNLNLVVRESVDLLQPELDNRGLVVREELAPSLPQAPLDRGQMKQVLVNLIKNALQAMTRGGVLTLRTGATNNGVWMSVSDTGCGISQERLQRIFEPFFTTKKKGSGLGLMIVQRIVRAHGGRIDIQSHQGQGTTFRIWIPVQERRPRLLGSPSKS